MNTLKTLPEVCNAVGVTRRAVQGYEEAGLVSAIDRNKYGYLLYGENEEKRIAKIKLFQEFRFTLKEIKGLIDAPNEVVKAALEKQLNKLYAEKDRLDALIAEAKAMIVKLSEE